MLKVYAWNACPHCRNTIQFLQEHGIPFEYLEIEEQPQEVIQQVINVNGGDDWVVPTLEYEGMWRPGEIYDPVKLTRTLKGWGLLPS